MCNLIVTKDCVDIQFLNYDSSAIKQFSVVARLIYLYFIRVYITYTHICGDIKRE